MNKPKRHPYSGFKNQKESASVDELGLVAFPNIAISKTKIISQFNNGNLMKIRNFFVNPKNINYFVVDDFEESMEDL